MPQVQDTYEPMTFDAIKVGLASPEKILEWSHGEVTKPETINYRTLKPENDGLYCEKIFGPTKDWECHCGKYKKIRFKGVVCDRCHVEITKASVRRERMGHIKLAAPVSHIWYFKGIPSRMGLILDVSPKALERVLYFAAYIVTDPGNVNEIKYKDVISEKEYRDLQDKYGEDAFNAEMGAEAVLKLLKDIDLEKLSVELKNELKDAQGQKAARIVKRLEVVEAFRISGNKPEWMIMTIIPVIPPDIRPMVQLDGGRFATSDLNDLYRRIINRNNRLGKLIEMNVAPDIVINNEKRMLQEAVDALIDNGRRGRPVTGPGNRALKSLSDMLKGKQGRFRQNLLGKRVDYSGRSVIVVGPELKIYQCGLPKEMAIELFKPFVMKELVKNGSAHNIKAAKKMVERLENGVWDVLEDVIKEHPVMLNRAPTLHRLGIQAFEPILVEGKAIKLHPLVCTAFNADFDGDQMAVHLPLSVEAQAECRFMLLSPNNLLKPSDGGVVAVPSQDMVLGIYYLTQEREGAKGEGMMFKSVNEAILAYENKEVTLHSRVKCRVDSKTQPESGRSHVIETTVGRLIFNEIIPQDLKFVDRSEAAIAAAPENEFLPEIDFLVKKGGLKKILEKVMNIHGATITAETLDAIKAMGYKYSTRAAMTVSIDDMIVPEEKKEIMETAQKEVDKIARNKDRGLITEDERYKEVISTWKAADDELTKKVIGGLGATNNLKMMADSGARGSDKQIKQLAGMRGLMADTTGHTIELPIKSNFREGLDILEYFISAHGARKGLSDTALRTADSGYLTRRLVDVSHDLTIREDDCCAGKEIPCMEIEAFKEGEESIETLKDRITGRFLAETIIDPETKEIVGKANHMVRPLQAQGIIDALEKMGRTSIKVRSVLTCRAKVGVCAKCYGANMATTQPVQVGEAVGIIAAQSIGEPGTQLTMRNFHTGGVASNQDITQGLPRVEELFEARKPKGVATISEIGGRVTLKDKKITVEGEEGTKSYNVAYNARLRVTDGQVIEAGDPLTEGPVDPHDLLKAKGANGKRAVQEYMLREVQKVYRLQGVEINDKHIEMIVHQMMKKVRIKESGDSEFLPETVVDCLEFEDANERLVAEGKEPATGITVLLGITKASLATDSFMSAASFQETTKVLTEAAIKGAVDHLCGLKENVLIGKLIPAGTGMKGYGDVLLSTDHEEAEAPAVEEAPAAEAEVSKEDAQDFAEAVEDLSDKDLAVAGAQSEAGLSE